MIGLDTNVLVRLLLNDDAGQAARARDRVAQLSASDPGFISMVVLVELLWVLQRSYKQGADVLRRVAGQLLETEQFVVQGPDVLRAALRLAEEGADLADALIAELARAAGCTETVTFDAGAARHAGMTLLS